jgi:hypothetical protein
MTAYIYNIASGLVKGKEEDYQLQITRRIEDLTALVAKGNLLKAKGGIINNNTLETINKLYNDLVSEIKEKPEITTDLTELSKQVTLLNPPIPIPKTSKLKSCLKITAIVAVVLSVVAGTTHVLKS